MKQSIIINHLKKDYKILPIQSNNKKPYYYYLKNGKYNKNITQYRERSLEEEVNYIIEKKLNYGIISNENFIRYMGR